MDKKIEIQNRINQLEAAIKQTENLGDYKDLNTLKSLRHELDEMQIQKLNYMDVNDSKVV